MEQVEDLVNFFDFPINEECHEYDECDILTTFIEAGKAVFNAEYDQRYINNKQKRFKMCSESFSLKMSALILPLDLDGSFLMNNSSQTLFKTHLSFPSADQRTPAIDSL